MIYSEWSEWSRCHTRTCTNRRSRSCLLLNGGRCPDDADTRDTKPCVRRHGRCSGIQDMTQRQKDVIGRRIEDVVYDLLYYDWSDWSACTRTCSKRRYIVLLEDNYCDFFLLLCNIFFPDNKTVDSEQKACMITRKTIQLQPSLKYSNVSTFSFFM